MVKIGRNDPCSCGSGKKYKNCCIKDSEAINIISYKYDKYLEARDLACGKVFAIGAKNLGIERSDPTFYLIEFLLNQVDINKIKSIRDLDYFIDNISFIFTIFGYPVYDLIEFDGEPDDFGFNSESIEDNYLWRYCLKNHIEEFTELEKKFLQSLTDSTAGFFKVLNTGTQENSSGYPIIDIEDIFNGRVYKIMDKSLYNGVVKYDIISGIIAPFHEDISVLESCPPILYPPTDRELLLNLIKEYSRVYKSKYRCFFSKRDDYGKLFKLFPVIIYLVSLDYFLIRLTRPLPRLVNYDKEEIVLSETSYKVKDKEKIKGLLINIRGIRLTEDLKKEAVLNWMNSKNTILGTIFLKNKRLLFQTNSMERLEKWKDMIKDIPIEFIKTDYTYLDDIQAKYSKGKKTSKTKKNENQGLNIPEEDFKKIALDWWEKYYNDWVNTKIPALGNITPEKAVKTKGGKEKVRTLIDEFENYNLHINKDATGNNFHRYFDPDELRKRLSLI